MKDAVLYLEKFINSKFRPSLSNFGGKAIDGFIAVTASGLVRSCSVVPNTQPKVTELAVTNELLNILGWKCSIMHGS